MAVEAKRGCGYRKVGGLYLVSGNLGQPCGRLPLELHVCPTCHAGIKQTRGWQWVNPGALLADSLKCATPAECGVCGMSVAHVAALKRAGLLWVGGSFYPEARDFMVEATALGVSRRIPAVPRGFKVGEDWVLIAHPRAIIRPPVNEEEEQELAAINAAHVKDGEPTEAALVRKGIITFLKPRAIEKIVTETQARDEAAMQALRDKGITPIAVPDDDPDHQGSVHEAPDDEPPGTVAMFPTITRTEELTT